ncbi:putative poly(A) polymerase small subunit [Yalta virus]|nr:putative poly(A) polymerase small subunit [Yalta virus]
MLKAPSIYNIEDIAHSAKYNPEPIEGPRYRIKMSGQLKLLLVEIRFLTEDVEIQTMPDKKFTVLYLGSGKGYHIPLLISLYEKYNIDWVFFDPNGHCSKLYEYKKLSSANIDIRDEYFTDKSIEEFKKIDNLLLINDIRTTKSNNNELVDTSPSTNDLLADYILQNNILKQLKPLFSLLKFRMPFPDDEWKEGLEFDKPVGKEYIQAFQKPASSEFRIFINSNIVFETVNTVEELKKYEEKFSWYNREYRFQKQNDLNIAYYIFQNYYNVEIPGKKINRKDIVKFLTTIQKSY